MSSSFWLLEVESCDFSQAEKERTACKGEQIHKMTTIFTQKSKWSYTANVCRDLQGLYGEIGVQGFQIYGDCMYTAIPAKIIRKFEKNLNLAPLAWAEFKIKIYDYVMYSLCCTLQYLQGIKGTLRGNQSAGISNLWGLHVYPQSLNFEIPHSDFHCNICREFALQGYYGDSLHAIPIIFMCILQGTFCDTGIPRTFYGGNICSVVYIYCVPVLDRGMQCFND